MQSLCRVGAGGEVCYKLSQVTKSFHSKKAQSKWESISLYNLALKLFSTPPLADALETVSVVAVGEDPKAALTRISRTPCLYYAGRQKKAPCPSRELQCKTEKEREKNCRDNWSPGKIQTGF